MTTTGHTAADIQRLSRRFLPHCDDRDTLLALEAMAADERLWPGGHALFQRIRAKTLVAERAGDRLKSAQYAFEEVCAKTLYNLSGFPAPFDEDAPDWIHPCAQRLAQALGIAGTQDVVPTAAEPSLYAPPMADLGVDAPRDSPRLRFWLACAWSLVFAPVLFHGLVALRAPEFLYPVVAFAAWLGPVAWVLSAHLALPLARVGFARAMLVSLGLTIAMAVFAVIGMAIASAMVGGVGLDPASPGI